MREAINSQTATQLGIKNIPSEKELKAMKLLATMVFEPLRVWYGKPIRINSFYRSPRLNAAVGGSMSSQHSKGEAIDISSGENDILFHWLKNNTEFDQLISEFPVNGIPQWIHVSYKEKGNRKEVLVAKKIKGRTVYEKLV